MVRSGKGRRKHYGTRRPPKRTQNTTKMMGHIVNKGLQYAQGIPGPVGLLARGLGMVKSLINVETKYLDVTNNATVSNAVNNYGVAINQVAEGDDYNQRNGRSILNDSLTINTIATIGAAATNTFIRCILVADKKPDAGVANIGDVIGSGGDYMTQIDKAVNGDRFVILRNWLFNLSSVTKQSEQKKLFVNLKGTHTTFDNTASDIEKNKLYFFALSNEATNVPTLYINSRFRYKDN